MLLLHVPLQLGAPGVGAPTHRARVAPPGQVHPVADRVVLDLEHLGRFWDSQLLNLFQHLQLELVGVGGFARPQFRGRHPPTLGVEDHVALQVGLVVVLFATNFAGKLLLLGMSAVLVKLQGAGIRVGFSTLLAAVRLITIVYSSVDDQIVLGLEALATYVTREVLDVAVYNHVTVQLRCCRKSFGTNFTNMVFDFIMNSLYVVFQFTWFCKVLITLQALERPWLLPFTCSSLTLAHSVLNHLILRLLPSMYVPPLVHPQSVRLVAGVVTQVTGKRLVSRLNPVAVLPVFVHSESVDFETGIVALLT